MIPVRYNIRSLVERRATSLMTAAGVALVVMILFVLLGFVDGMRRSFRAASGDDNNWIVVARGLTTEPASHIDHTQLQILRVRPEIASDRDGTPLMSPEFIDGVNVAPNRRRTQFTFLREAQPIAYRVHRNMHLIAGRWPEHGRDEWVVGQRLAAKYPSLAIGTLHRFGRGNWTVVGVFSDRGSARESEIWTDYDALVADAHVQEPGAATVHVLLKPGTAESFKAALRNDSRLKVDAMSEREFYADQSGLSGEVKALGLLVAILMAAGAIFGGMNTMYAAVARRGREVGVLRALGFSRADVIVSFIVESALLGLAGGIAGELLGVGAAWATGLDSQMMTVGVFLFSDSLSASAFVTGLIVALTIGVCGGVPPALRAARIGVIDALREA